MVDEKELDEFMDDWDKQITQEDKIDESVGETIAEMGWLWDAVRDKLEKDKICFVCKKQVDFDKEHPPRVVQATRVEPGVVAFVSICDDCYSKLLEDKKKKEEEENERGKKEESTN